MNPLQPTKVYVAQEPPDGLTDKCQSRDDGYCDLPSGTCKQCFPPSKSASLYCFTKEELLDILSKTWDNKEEMLQYIKQLLP